MRKHSFLSFVLVLSTAACVDRVFIDVGTPSSFPVVVDGHISDQPGPYSIQINQAFDIESKQNQKVPVDAKSVIISDNLGNSEKLFARYPGLYQTDTTGKGIRGIVGRIYKLRVELPDGRIYESLPDTLLAAGKLDSVYSVFIEEKQNDFGALHGFDIFFNASGGDKSSAHFIWEFTGTFQAETSPQPSLRNGCEMIGAGKCNYVPLCSGLRNIGGYTFVTGIWERVAPCTCCTCWYNIFSSTVTLSDDRLLRVGDFKNVNIGHVPFDPYIFSHKIYIEVSQMSLTNQSYLFWRAIRDQKNATNSLFQPVTGKIPSNFTQLSGTEAPIQGLFLATSLSKKTIMLTKEDAPVNIDFNSAINVDALNTACPNLFPNAKTKKPSFWKD